MVIKKYTVLVASILALQMSSFAQKSGWDWKDSSVIPVKSISQFNEFKQNKNPYPAKPRNAWELGASIGPSMVFGDVASKIGFGASLTARKALNNVFAVRFGYYGSFNGGKSATYDYTGLNDLYVASGTESLGKYKTPDYKNKTHQLFTEIVASINTFSNYRGDPKANLYVLGGLGIIASGTSIDTGSGFHYVRGINASSNLPRYKKQGSQVFLLGYSYGVGFAYKINSQFNIGFEQRFSASVFPFTYVDGYRAPDGRKNDIYSYSGFRINYNLLK